MLLLLACTAPPDDTFADTTPTTRTVIAVSSYFAGVIHLYDADGQPLSTLDGLDGAQTVTLSPSGELVACAEGLNELHRFDARTFAPLGVLADTGFDGPTAATFGPDGRLYVASFNDDRVARLEADGTYVDDAVPGGLGGLDGPDIGMTFGPDGALYVPSWYDGAVYAYTDGAPSTVVASGTWSGPRGLAWEGGELLAAMNGDGVILRVGAATSTALEPRRPDGIAWLGDRLLVASGATNKVTAWDLATGTNDGVFIDDPAIDGATAVAVLELPAP